MAKNTQGTHPFPAAWDDPEHLTVRQRLASEKLGGTLLLIAAAAALIAANSPLGDFYRALSSFEVGVPVGHFMLSLSDWSADGLLAIFFFTAGLELKHEFTHGSLRDPKQAALPICAAVAGMAVPAIIYAIIIATSGVDALSGWAVPTATDIAFAVAVLAVFGRGLPVALRMFLLTLAVVDDLLAILVIAIFFTNHVDFLALGLAIIPIALFAWLSRRRRMHWYFMLPVGIAAWACMLQSGVHATIAGVLLGFVVPAGRIRGERWPRTDILEHDWKWFSQMVALPIFAFFAAGVQVSAGGSGSLLSDPVLIAVAAGLILGKPIGIWAATMGLSRIRGFTLDRHLRSGDILAAGMIAGIGFTVSLLIAQLAFPGGGVMHEHADHATLGVLAGSLLSAILGALALRWRVHSSRRREVEARIEREANEDDEEYLP